MSMKSIARYMLIRIGMVYRLLGGDQRSAARYIKNHKITKLHIGAGSNVLAGWLNVDYFALRLRVLHMDATRKFPFEDARFDYVFNEHMIEHIPHIGAMKMLREIHRVLKPGGILRVSTPDIGFLVDLLKDELSSLQTRYVEESARHYVPSALPGHEAVFVVNNFFYNFGHCMIMTKGLLRAMLEDAGFRNIVEKEILQSDYEELRGLENVNKLSTGFLELESMIFEATKV